MDKNSNVFTVVFATVVCVVLASLLASTYNGLKTTIDDNNNASSCTYDSVNRQAVCTDPKGNRAQYDYDANSNVVTVTETEKSAAALSPPPCSRQFPYKTFSPTVVLSSALLSARSYQDRAST